MSIPPFPFQSRALFSEEGPSEACNCSVVCQELNLAGSGHLGSVARSSVSSFQRMLIWDGWCTAHPTHTVCLALCHVPPPAHVTAQQLLLPETGPSCHTINQVQIHARGQISPGGLICAPCPKGPSLLLGPVLTQKVSLSQAAPSGVQQGSDTSKKGEAPLDLLCKAWQCPGSGP